MAFARLMQLVLATIVLAAGAPFPAGAADEGPKHLACTFETGHTWSYEAGKFQSAPPSPLRFEIDEINLETQSARLIVEGKPAGALRIVRALNANHFLEVANEGFLNLTTIYDADATTGLLPGVHSRHFGIFGQPVFAQYAGTCAAK